MDMYFLVHLIATYGYYLVLIGTFLEGETVVLIGGALAKNGPLYLPYVWLAAFLGSLAGDQLLFWLGKKYGRGVVLKYAWLNRFTQKSDVLIQEYGTILIVGFRFLYGLRVVIPIFLGAAGVSTLKFLLLNILGAALWAGLFSGISYAFANAIDSLLAQHGFLHLIFLGFASLVVVFLVAHWYLKSEQGAEKNPKV